MLEGVGFSGEQAETSVNILVEIMEDRLATKQDMKDLRLATQQDLQDFRIAMKQDLQGFRAETKQEFQEVRLQIEKLRSELMIRLGTMVAGAIAIMTALQAYLIKFH